VKDLNVSKFNTLGCSGRNISKTRSRSSGLALFIMSR
jgi:hypothetical protein